MITWAYAVGNDIHFGRGQYEPASEQGQHLIAHEVAHTVQQGGGAVERGPQFQLEVSRPGDAQEVEADRAADAMVAGVQTSVLVPTLNHTIQQWQRGTANRKLVQREAPKDAPLFESLPTNPLDPDVPQSVNWDVESSGGGPLVSGNWHGAPSFRTVLWNGGITPESADGYRRVGDGKDRFAVDWSIAQTAFNATAKEMEPYNEARKDAKEKSADGIPINGKNTIDLDLEDATVPGSDVPIGKSFGANGEAAPGFDPKRLPAKQRGELAPLKAAIDGKDALLEASFKDTISAKIEVTNAVQAHHGTFLAGEELRKEAEKANLQTNLDKIQRYAGECKDLLGNLKEVAAGSLIAAAQALSTIVWEDAIRTVMDRIQKMTKEIQGLQQLKIANDMQIAIGNL